MSLSFILRIGNFILLVVNIALFALWFSMIRKDALPVGGDANTYVLGQVSLQITILGIVIALVAVALTGLGFLGMQTVLERSEVRADRTAREVAERYFQQFDEGAYFRSADRGLGARRRTMRRDNLPKVRGATEESGDL